MSQNLRSPRETPRLIDAVRRGAEAGVAQVLTPAEALALVAGLPEFTCPACGAVVRARMADHVSDTTLDV